MIQRKQTIYLLLALACLIVCLCLPLATYEYKGMGGDYVWYNLGRMQGNGFQTSLVPFAGLVIAATFTLCDIFLYSKRVVQARLCTVNILLCTLWYAYWFGFRFLGLDSTNSDVHFHFAFCLPAVAIVFFAMARAGIKADEALVKSTDRIR